MARKQCSGGKYPVGAIFKKAAFKDLFESSKPNAHWLIINLPDNIKGAFVTRNALGGLIGNVGHNICNIQKNDIFQAQAMNKEKCLCGITPVRLVYWNSASSRFEDVPIGEHRSRTVSVQYFVRETNQMQLANCK